MYIWRTTGLLLCIAAIALAVPRKDSDNSVSNLKPSEWLSAEELKEMPSLEELTLKRLEEMPLNKGAELIHTIFHLARADHSLQANFVPSPSNIPVYIVNPKGQKINVELNNLIDAAKQQPNFGSEEVTIFITGLPEQNSQDVKKATRKLIQSYMQRYSAQQSNGQQQNKDYDYGSGARTSSEENNEADLAKRTTPSGNLIVIDLGNALTNFKRIAMLNVPQTGAMIGKVLVQLTNEVGVPNEIMHVVAQGIAAHVAGAAGNQYTRLTGHQLRRITALDPSKIFAKNTNTLTSLSRGDAEFVDAIHTSAYGMGIARNVGDVDFYPNGPAQGVPGAANVVEAAMRATRYFAESVRPGNERNFPAIRSNSLQQYKNNNGIGQRTYMGIYTDFDVKGNYMLEVNENRPFGQRAPAQRQSAYHGARDGWKNDLLNVDY